MIHYLIRRLLLLPVTLFAIILVNFVILNLAPGDPVSRIDISSTGEANRSADSQTAGENAYLQFREHYGLTLPVLFNSWPSLSEASLKQALEQLASRKKYLKDEEDMSVQDYHALRTLWGDRARYLMPSLLKQVQNPEASLPFKKTAFKLLIRGGTRQGHVGSFITEAQKLENRKIASDNNFLENLKIKDSDSGEQVKSKIAQFEKWMKENAAWTTPSLTFWDKAKIFFLETRFFRYLSRVTTLNFGTLRNDSNKTVLSEVVKRIKYSLTLAVLPMIATFALCQLFGMLMAVYQDRWVDLSLNVLFLILFAIPVFVVAPFLIEKVALHHTVPFTSIPIPFSGFHSQQEVYKSLTSPQRLGDIFLHIFLPLIAIMYGTLAVQARLSRTAILEVLRQDYVRTARAKGLPPKTILIKHVGRNAAITIVTSLAASLGVILGGSLIVETVFEINGFGRFFYDAIINRDYNVVLFSAFAGSLLTLIGYLVADLSYPLLDPRVSLE